MRVLSMDTETTGLPGKQKQVHVMELAAKLEETTNRRSIMQYSSLIRPTEFWTPSPEAIAVHNISPETCMVLGVDQELAFESLDIMLGHCHCIVGYNLIFDLRVILDHAQDLPPVLYNSLVTSIVKKAKYDMMFTLQDYTRLPGRYGKYKWPKLTEAYKHIYGLDMTGAHGAEADRAATMEFYYFCVAFRIPIYEIQGDPRE